MLDGRYIDSIGLVNEAMTEPKFKKMKEALNVQH